MKNSSRLAQAKVHFIGIGGIGMCGLAELLHNMGAQVTGSDAHPNMQTHRLETLGIPIFKGHQTYHLGDAEVVVYSSAVPTYNVEFQEARRRRVPLIRRAEALAEIMRLKRGIAIAGTHGKTTTTSLTASIFLAAQTDPTIIVGGRLDVIKSTAVLGQGEWLVAEADESDGSLTRLSPEIVVITNVDNDHLDHFGHMENLRQAFLEFALRIPFYGVAIICGDDPMLKKLFFDFPKKKIFYGFSEDNDVVVSNINGKYLLKTMDSESMSEISVPLPGGHNALNATAALLVAKEVGLNWTDSLQTLKKFKGVDRRFQHKATLQGMEFYDDYGHHPTEIKAVLSGCRERFPQKRLVVIFQPHRYSRTQICWEEFRHCFNLSDVVYLLDIYPAGELPIEGVEAKNLAAQMDPRKVHYISRQEDPLLMQVQSQLHEGDVILTLGAGDIYKLGELMIERLAQS